MLQHKTPCAVLATGFIGLASLWLEAANGQDGSSPSWTAGDGWELDVKVYSRSWMLDSSDPEQNRSKDVPRVQYEYRMSVRVADIVEDGGTDYAQLDFIPSADAPEHIAPRRCRLTVDMAAMRVVHAECRQDDGAGDSKLVPLTVGTGASAYSALFSKEYLPIDWVIESGDEGKTGTDCLRLRRPSEAMNKGHWELINLPDLAEETPYTYETEFRRTVTAEAGTVKVVASRRSSFQDKPAYEVEQVWDPDLAWWRSFSRRLQGHLDLEATMVNHSNR